MGTPTTDQWLCITDYAQQYGVSRPTVYKWMDAGLLVTYRVNSIIRIYNHPPGTTQTTSAHCQSA